MTLFGTDVAIGAALTPDTPGAYWEITTVDSEGRVGQYPSLAFNAGFPAVTYSDWTDSPVVYLKYAYNIIQLI